MGIRLLEGLSISQYAQIPWNTWVDRNGITVPDTVAAIGLTPIATNGAKYLVVTVDSSTANSPVISIALWDERWNCIGLSASNLNTGGPTNSNGFYPTITWNSQVGVAYQGVPEFSLSNVYGFNVFVGGFTGSQTVNLHYKLV